MLLACCLAFTPPLPECIWTGIALAATRMKMRKQVSILPHWWNAMTHLLMNPVGFTFWAAFVVVICRRRTIAANRKNQPQPKRKRPSERGFPPPHGCPMFPCVE